MIPKASFRREICVRLSRHNYFLAVIHTKFRYTVQNFPCSFHFYSFFFFYTKFSFNLEPAYKCLTKSVDRDLDPRVAPIHHADHRHPHVRLVALHRRSSRGLTVRPAIDFSSLLLGLASVSGLTR